MNNATLVNILDDVRAEADAVAQSPDHGLKNEREAIEKALADNPELRSDLESKLESYFHVIQEAHMKAIKAKVYRDMADQDLANALRTVSWLEGRVEMTMKVLGMKKLDLPNAKFTLTKGRDVLKVGPNFDLDLIPDSLKTIVPEQRKINKVEAFKAVKGGEEYDGLWIEEGPESLRYKKPKGE